MTIQAEVEERGWRARAVKAKASVTPAIYHDVRDGYVKARLLCVKCSLTEEIRQGNAREACKHDGNQVQDY